MPLIGQKTRYKTPSRFQSTKRKPVHIEICIYCSVFGPKISLTLPTGESLGVYCVLPGVYLNPSAITELIPLAASSLLSSS